MSQPLEKTDPAEGSVDWDAAAEYMTGGAGEEEAPEAKADDEPREFRYRGRTVKVDAATHGLLEDLRKEARGANGRLGSELAKARERLARLEGVIAAREEARVALADDLVPPDPKLAIKDIAAWQREFDAYQTAKIARRERELEAKYERDVAFRKQQEDQSRRDREWSDRFYTTYDHLDDPELKKVVAQVFIDNQAEIEPLPEEEAHELLAELADKRLVRLRKQGKGATTTTNHNSRRPPRVETSAGLTPGGTPKEPERTFSSASWSARSRLKMFGQDARKKE